MKKFTNALSSILSFIKLYIDKLNSKIIIIFSILSSFLGLFVYLFEEYFIYYFCGNNSYYTAYKCNSIYDNIVVYLYIIFIGISLLFSILVLIKKHKENYKLLKFIIFFLFIGILLSILMWDDSSGLGFNINFGPIVLVVIFLFIAILISSFAWSYFLKRRYILFLPFFFLLFFSILNIESIKSFTDDLKIFKTKNDCNKVILEIGKNACKFNKAVKKNDPYLCKNISDLNLTIECSDYIYSNQAIFTKNPKLCELVVVPLKKDFCYKEEIRY